MAPDNPPPEEEERPRKRRKRVKTPKDAKMNMTPMIDVVFLLIVFFMLVTEMSKMEIESITLPYALSAKEDPPEEETRIVVNLTAKGDIRWMHAKKTPEEFLMIVKARAERCPRDPDGLPIMSVKIRADARCEYKHVQEIMVQCMKAYVWKLAFGASPVDNEDMLLYD